MSKSKLLGRLVTDEQSLVAIAKAAHKLNISTVVLPGGVWRKIFLGDGVLGLKVKRDSPPTVAGIKFTWRRE